MDAVIYVILFALPLLNKLADKLEKLDKNPEGADDTAARAIRTAISDLELWLLSRGHDIIPANADEIVIRYSEQLKEEAKIAGTSPRGVPPKTKAK